MLNIAQAELPYELVDEKIPIRTVSFRRHSSEPWFDDDCRMAKRSVRRLKRFDGKVMWCFSNTAYSSTSFARLVRCLGHGWPRNAPKSSCGVSMVSGHCAQLCHIIHWQCVRCRSAKSTHTAVLFGVPQGIFSVFGLILISVYCWYIGLIEAHGLWPCLYADDTQIYGFCCPSDSALHTARKIFIYLFYLLTCCPSDSAHLQSWVSACVSDVGLWIVNRWF